MTVDSLWGIADVQPYADLIRSVEPALQFLQSRVGFDCWTVARKVDDEYIVVAAQDRGYGIAGGEVLRWQDTICARMVLGLGPRVAPSLALVPAYLRAPFTRHTPVGAYLGVPLHGPDGDLIGTLAALHPTEAPDAILDELPMIEAMAKVIAGSLSTSVLLAERGKLTEVALADASTDPLTGLGNRRAWEWMITAEEERCARFGRPAAILSIDLDGLKETNDAYGHAAGDDLLRRAAVAISSAVRAHDVVARLGGDEFGVLAIECDGRMARRLGKRIAKHLEAEEVRASIGIAGRGEGGLSAACQEADAAMYSAKRHLRASR